MLTRVVVIIMCIRYDAAVSVNDLEQRLQLLRTDWLRVGAFQEIISGKLTTNVTVNEDVLLANVTGELQVFFKQCFTVVESTKASLEKMFQANVVHTTVFRECCNINETDLGYDPSLRRMVANNWCYSVSSNTTNIASLPFNTTTLAAITEYRRAASSYVKYIYFGSTDGYLTVLPSFSFPFCYEFDPRKRPWYSEGSASTYKDLVILMDVSHQMNGPGVIDISKSIAETIIRSLNRNDRVTLVTFNFGTKTPVSCNSPTCFLSSLAYASSDVQLQLLQCIASVQASGQFRYLLAFDQAIQLLHKQSDYGVRDKCIILMTRGEMNLYETKDQILSYVNATLGGTTMFVYAVGDGLSTEQRDFLQQLSALNINVNASGSFQQIKTLADVQSGVTSFYRYFVRNGLTSPVVSTPYIDYGGVGHILSVCLPVYYPSTTLKGVTCVDVKISDLFKSSPFFKQSRFSYPFIFDETGRALVHPRLPPPGTDYTASPIILNITYLEPQIGDIFGTILQQLNSTDAAVFKRTFTQNVFRSRGDPSLYGVAETMTTSLYLIRKIPGTKLFVGIVLSEEDQKTYSSPNDLTPVSFLYHQSIASQSSQCGQNGKLSVSDQSAVVFTPDAFKDPDRLLNQNETIDDIVRYENFMYGMGANHGLTECVRSHVTATESLQWYWNLDDVAEKASVAFKFIGTHCGVYRVFPGTRLPRGYDHTLEQWYQKALVFRNSLVLHRSHLTNEFGQGDMIMLSAAVQLKVTTGAIFGVIGASVQASFLSSLVRYSVAQCNTESFTCLLVDEGGYIVYDSENQHVALGGDFLHLSLRDSSWSDLLIQNHMTVTGSCFDFAWQQQYRFWQLNVTQSTYFSVNVSVHPINDTNTFLLIKPRAISPTPCGFCASGNVQACGSPQCACPCEHSLQDLHVICNNSFEITASSVDLCVAASSIDRSFVPPDEPTNKNACYMPTCNDINMDWMCDATETCSWCVGDHPADSGCYPVNQCFVNHDQSRLFIIVGACAGGVFIITLASVGVMVSRRCRNSRRLCPRAVRKNRRETSWASFGSTIQTSLDSNSISGGTIVTSPRHSKEPTAQETIEGQYQEVGGDDQDGRVFKAQLVLITNSRPGSCADHHDYANVHTVPKRTYHNDKSLSSDDINERQSVTNDERQRDKPNSDLISDSYLTIGPPGKDTSGTHDNNSAVVFTPNGPTDNSSTANQVMSHYYNDRGSANNVYANAKVELSYYYNNGGENPPGNLYSNQRTEIYSNGVNSSATKYVNSNPEFSQYYNTSPHVRPAVAPQEYCNNDPQQKSRSSCSYGQHDGDLDVSVYDDSCIRQKSRLHHGPDHGLSGSEGMACNAELSRVILNHNPMKEETSARMISDRQALPVADHAHVYSHTLPLRLKDYRSNPSLFPDIKSEYATAINDVNSHSDKAVRKLSVPEHVYNTSLPTSIPGFGFSQPNRTKAAVKTEQQYSSFITPVTGINDNVTNLRNFNLGAAVPIPIRKLSSPEHVYNTTLPTRDSSNHGERRPRIPSFPLTQADEAYSTTFGTLV